MGKDWPEIKKALGTTGTPHIGVQLRIASIDGKDRSACALTAKLTRQRCKLARRARSCSSLRATCWAVRLLCDSCADFADYADPQTTAETLRSDGWQHTGDVGKLVNGQLYITDRYVKQSRLAADSFSLKDVFKVGAALLAA